MRAPERARTLLRSLRPTLRRGPARRGHGGGGGGAHLGSAPGRGRRSVANAGGRTWLEAAAAAAAATRVERSAAQPTGAERAPAARQRHGGGGAPRARAAAEDLPGPRDQVAGPVRFLAGQGSGQPGVGAAGRVRGRRYPLGGGRCGGRAREVGDVGTIAGPPGSPGLRWLLGPGRGLWSPRGGSAVGVGPAAGSAPRPRRRVPGERAVSARRRGFQCGPCLARPPPLYTLASRARGPPIHTRTHSRRPGHTAADAPPALRAARGAPGTPSFAPTAPARPGLAAVTYCPISRRGGREPSGREMAGPRSPVAGPRCEEVGGRGDVGRSPAVAAPGRAPAGPLARAGSEGLPLGKKGLIKDRAFLWGRPAHPLALPTGLGSSWAQPLLPQWPSQINLFWVWVP